MSLVCNSSLYFDEDGDLAHEFYEETIVTKNGRRRAKLKRIQKNLIPQVKNVMIVCLFTQGYIAKVLFKCCSISSCFSVAILQNSCKRLFNTGDFVVVLL